MPPRRRYPIRRPPPGRRVDHSPAREMLIKAHHTMERGEYQAAAEQFNRLAEGAQKRGMIRQASRLYLQAGRAAFLSDQEESGKRLIKKALGILADNSMGRLLSFNTNRTIAELRNNGQNEFALALENWLQQTLPEGVTHLQPFLVGKREKTLLPTKCPSCGGPILSDEVEWVDTTTALCPYCGSGVRGGD